MLYKLASAVLASTTGRAVAAMRFRKKERCAFGAAAVRRLLLMTGVATFLSLSLPGGGHADSVTLSPFYTNVVMFEYDGDNFVGFDVMNNSGGTIRFIAAGSLPIDLTVSPAGPTTQ
jgi:hypothetical protein